ncbi:MAG TPA: hypothetical protein VNH18_21135, partial [Bryobacteraceae bacterium]|nr:hypothetical protein [Bryobacteraceae bacterium]
MAINITRFLRRNRNGVGFKRGSALLTVLWLTAALSAIGLAVAHNVRGETERAGTNVEDVKAFFLARGAIERAVLYRQWGGDYYKFGTPFLDFSFPTGQVRVEIIPETSRLGLNTATPDELMRLLMALGEPEDRATETVAAIIDWRTPASREHPGLFETFYLSRVPSFLPAHASFKESEELLLVRGITPDLFYGTSLDGSRSGLRDCISAASMGGSVDINTARRETFIAIGIAPQDADAILALRSNHPILDYKEVAEIQHTLGPAGARLAIGGSSMVTFRATARMLQPDGKLSDLRRTVSALIKYFAPDNKLGKPPGPEVVRWY